MVNVLHIIDHYRIGGPGKTIINSSKYIDKDNFSIGISSFLPNIEKETEFSSSVKKNGIPYLGLLDQDLLNLRNLKKLIRFINENKINIIHSHGYRANIIALITKAVCPNLIIVSTAHGWIVNSLKQLFYYYLDLSILNFFDGIICVSNKINTTIKRHCIKKPSLITIHNGIVIDDYKISYQKKDIIEALCMSSENKIIGYIGRLSREKGILDLIELFNNAILKKMPNVKMLIIGEGPLKQKVVSFINEHNLSKHIVLINYQNPIQPYYECMDILVSPSYTEGISNVILEAMCYGIPVVATNVGGNSEIINHQVNGILVDRIKFSSIADNVELLLGDEKYYNQISINAKLKVHKEFNFLFRMRKVEKFYYHLLRKAAFH